MKLESESRREEQDLGQYFILKKCGSSILLLTQQDSISSTTSFYGILKVLRNGFSFCSFRNSYEIIPYLPQQTAKTWAHIDTMHFSLLGCKDAFSVDIHMYHFT